MQMGINMKKELEYFKIGQSFGGRQDWFRDKMMYLGGCAAVTACDSCIYFAINNKKEKYYSFDVSKLKKEDYLDFAKIMKPYLRPRIGGINKLDVYLAGLEKYFLNIGESNVEISGYSGNQELKDAKEVIRTQINKKVPIPYLLLRHKNRTFKAFVWHWFLIVGYEEFEGEFMVKIVTYGNFHWLSFSELWNTGYGKKGGMILFENIS